jgi:transposase
MDKDQEIERLRQENQELKAALQQALETIAQLTQRVQDLEARLAKDSHNSHLPPSSDRFSRQPKSLRKKSEKPSGGQAGHPGHHLTQVAAPDLTVVQEVSICEPCQQDLRAQPVDHLIRRQVVDLPIPKVVITEYQLECKRCPRCQSMSQAPAPQDLTAPIQYSPSIAALAVYLSQVQLLPDGRIAHLFADLFGLPISTGSIHRWIAQCAEHLLPVEEAIKTALQRAPVLHQDETGLYQGGKRVWMHVSSTASLTHYGVHAKRGREAMDALGIAPHFQGIGVHDGWESYQGYTYPHALCNVHHLRELTFIEETFGQGWATRMKELLLCMKRCCDQARANGQSDLDPLVRQSLVERYEAIIEEGYAAHPPDPPTPVPKRGRRKQHPARCLLIRLHERQEQVLAFLHHLDVPFDNSQAERDIRMVKVQQKVSGCFRGEQGAPFFCRIRGYVSTMSKQGHALLALLEGAITGHPVFPQF